MNPEKELFDEWFEKEFGNLKPVTPHTLFTLNLIRDGMCHAWIAGRNALKKEMAEHVEWKQLRDYEYFKHVEKEEENEC